MTSEGGQCLLEAMPALYALVAAAVLRRPVCKVLAGSCRGMELPPTGSPLVQASGGLVSQCSMHVNSCLRRRMQA